MLYTPTSLQVYVGPPGGRHQASDRDRDAEPIRACHEFAVRELTDEYRFPIGLHVDDDFDDVDRYKWIAATPATTFEEWQAKAIALSAWSGRAYFADEPDGTGMRRFSRPCFRT